LTKRKRPTKLLGAWGLGLGAWGLGLGAWGLGLGAWGDHCVYESMPAIFCIKIAAYIFHNYIVVHKQKNSYNKKHRYQVLSYLRFLE
jgi:hypothetical protein